MLAHSVHRVLVVGLVAALAYWALAACAAPTVVLPVPAARAGEVAEVAIVVVDATPLRAGPHDSAPQQALLWAGDVLEIRAERLDRLQVYDHGRERSGFVASARVRRLRLVPDAAPELLAVVRFLRETNGAEALGIGYAAAWLRAASAQQVQGPAGAEVLEALGGFADRLAQRASTSSGAGKAADAALAAHLESVARHGVRFVDRERDGRARLCYDGEAYARVLALPAGAAQQARAALALTRPECADPDLRPLERRRDDELRGALMERVEVAALPPPLRVRVAIRRAALWSELAYARMRQGDASASQVAAQRALDALGSIDNAELSDDDRNAYADAAMRVNASRWAASTGVVSAGGLRIDITAGPPGETCIALVDTRRPSAAPLATRCTYAQVWPTSFSVNREGNAAALAVQTGGAWRELWIFRRRANGWSLQVLPPAASGPEVGYAEFAGWVPGGRQVLAARESRVDGRYQRSFEVVRLDDLATERRSSDPAGLGAFQRWADPAWKRDSVSRR